MRFPQFNLNTRSLFSRLLLLTALIGVVSTTFAQKSIRLVGLTPEASVTPIEINGNPSCATLNANNAQFPNITTDFELKIDSPFSHGGPWFFQSSGNRVLTGPTDLSNTLTTSGTGTTLNFSSTKAISAVMIKAGSSSNVYYYPSGSFGDTNLVVASNSISHVSFCYYQPANVTIIKEVTTNPFGTSSTFAFNFSATGLSVPNFSLVDQDVVGPDRYIQSNIYTFAPSVITVTEALAPPESNWSLADIVCTETAGGGVPNVNDTTDNFPIGTSANIRLQQGESVTCIFKNTQLQPSAAAASVSGRVVNSLGVGVSGARLTVVDVQTGSTHIATSNPFGYYTIDDLEVGIFYMMSISHKRFTFADDTRSFTLQDNAVGVDFTANPE